MCGVEPSSGVQFVWAAPIGLQEMVFAVWLLAKGFDTRQFGAATRAGGLLRDAGPVDRALTPG